MCTQKNTPRSCRLHTVCRAGWVVLWAMILTGRAAAQDLEAIAKAPVLAANGGVSLNQILTLNPGGTAAANPYALYLSGNLQLNAFGAVSVPLSFAYTNQQFTKSASLPFNRFSIAPSYKWLKVYAGYASMQFSPYTLAGHEIFGGGVELSPDNGFRISAIAGRLKQANEGVDGMEPSYRRMGGGVKVGYRSERFEVAANICKATDIAASLNIPDSARGIAPQDNLFGSISGSLHLMKDLLVGAEYGISAVNRNTAGQAEAFRLWYPGGDAAVYHAFKTNVSYTLASGSIGATYERVNPNYTTFGAYHSTNDYEHLAANIAARIKQFNAALDVGYQHDNLQSQKTNTASSLLLAGNISADFGEKWTVAADFSNVQSFVYINDVYRQVTQTNEFQNLDTLNVTQLNFTMGLNSSYVLTATPEVRQSINVHLMYQNSSEKQQFSGYAGNDIYNASLSCQHALIPARFNASAGINYNYNRLPDGRYMQAITVNASAQKTFMEVIRTGLIATLSNMYNEGSNRSDVLNLRLTAGYVFMQMHNLNLQVAAIYQHGSTQKTPLQYSLNLSYSYAFSAGLTRREKQWKVDAKF